MYWAKEYIVHPIGPILLVLGFVGVCHGLTGWERTLVRHKTPDHKMTDTTCFFRVE